MPCTPGPWTAPSAGIWTADGECLVASLGDRDCVKSRRRYARKYLGDCETSNQRERETRTADCLLIAAAPDLLEICERMLLRLDLEPVDAIFPGSAMREPLRAVIRSAKGE